MKKFVFYIRLSILLFSISVSASDYLLENSCKLLFYPTEGVISSRQGTVQLTITPHCDIATMRNGWPFAFGVNVEENRGRSRTALGILRTPGLDEWDGLSAVARGNGDQRFGLVDMKCPVKAGQKVNLALTWGPAGLFLYVDGRCIGRSQFEKELLPLASVFHVGRMAPFYVRRIAVSATQLSKGALNFNSDKDFVADKDCTLLANKLSEPQFFPAPSFRDLVSLAPFDLTYNRIFYAGEKLEFAFMTNNFTSKAINVTAKLSFTPIKGKKEQYTRTIRLTPKTVQKKITLDFPPHKPGLYTIEISSVQTKKWMFRVSVLPKLAGPEGRLRNYLGAANNRMPELFKRINLHWVRFWGSPELNWFQLEPMKNRWDFATADRVVNAYLKNDVNILAVLGYPPLWAAKPPPRGEQYKKYKFHYNRPGRWQPGNLKEWENYIKKTAKHFKGRIHCYEIYNEVDFKPPGIAASFSGTTEDYFKLLKSSSQMIRKTDSKNKILISGFSMIPGVCDTDMPEDLLKMGAANYIDIWNLHAYRALVNVPEMKKMIKSRKPGTPLWQTEQMWHIMKDKSKIRYLTVAINFWFLEQGFERYMTFGWNEFLSDVHNMSPQDPLHVFAVNQQFITKCETYVGKHPQLPESDFDVRHVLHRKDGKYLTAVGSGTGSYLIGFTNPETEIYDLLGRKIKAVQNKVETNHGILYFITDKKLNINLIECLDEAQLLTNTGFEDLGGDAMGGIENCVPSGWVLRLQYDPKAAIKINPKTPYKGKYAVNLTTSGKGRVYMFNLLKLSSPGTYHISANFRNISGKARPYICAFDTTAGTRYLVRKNFPTPPGNSYKKYNLDINLKKVPGDKLAVIFGVDGGAGTISCDEVEMKKMETPAFPATEAVPVTLKGTPLNKKLHTEKGVQMDVSSLASLNGKRQYAGVPFEITQSGILVADKSWNLPESVDIPVPAGRYSEIHGLTGAMYVSGKKGTELATLTLFYSGGQTAKIPVRNMVETRDWYVGKDTTPVPDPVAKIKQNDLSHRYLYHTKFSNPFPEKVLRKIKLSSSAKGIILFAGITLRKTMGPVKK